MVPSMQKWSAGSCRGASRRGHQGRQGMPGGSLRIVSPLASYPNASTWKPQFIEPQRTQRPHRKRVEPSFRNAPFVHPAGEDLLFSENHRTAPFLSSMCSLRFNHLIPPSPAPTSDCPWAVDGPRTCLQGLRGSATASILESGVHSPLHGDGIPLGAHDRAL